MLAQVTGQLDADGMYEGIFESSQLEGVYVEDLLYRSIVYEVEQKRFEIM